MALRVRNGLVLVRAETTEGVDSVPTAAADALAAFSISRNTNPDVVEDNEFRGGLGSGEPVIGAFRPQLTTQHNFYGSGTPATPPRLAALFPIAELIQTINPFAATIPTTGTTTAASGSATTITIDRTVGNGADWPASTLLGIPLLGNPVLLAGNPATQTVDFITGYTVAGNIATITFSRTYSPILSVATTIVRPNCIVWGPGAPSPDPSASVYLFRDGILERFVGCRANLALTMRGGNKWSVQSTINGVLLDRTDVAVPTATFDLTSPSIWTNGIMTINRVDAAVSQMTIDLGNQGQFPTNPNALAGIDPYLVGSRRVTGSVDPILTLVATRNLLASLQAQTKLLIAAMLGGRTGGSPGNRWGIVIPNAKLMDNQITEDNVILRETVPFQCTGFVNEFFLSHF